MTKRIERFVWYISVWNHLNSTDHRTQVSISNWICRIITWNDKITAVCCNWLNCWIRYKCEPVNANFCRNAKFYCELNFHHTSNVNVESISGYSTVQDMSHICHIESLWKRLIDWIEIVWLDWVSIVLSSHDFHDNRHQIPDIILSKMFSSIYLIFVC